MPQDESKTLGRLEQAFEQLAEQSHALFQKSDESQAQLAGLAVTIEHLSGLIQDVRTELKELRGKVGDLQSARDRGIGLLAGVGLVSGGAGAAVAKLFGLFGGHPPGG